jgi:hypothetical protein
MPRSEHAQAYRRFDDAGGCQPAHDAEDDFLVIRGAAGGPQDAYEADERAASRIVIASNIGDDPAYSVPVRCGRICCVRLLVVDRLAGR